MGFITKERTIRLRALAMDTVLKPLASLKLGVNNSLAGKEPWQIVTLTTTTVLVLVWLHDFIHQEESKLISVLNDESQLLILGVTQRVKKTVFRLAKLIPSIRKKIDTELQNVNDRFENETVEKTKHLKYITSLPVNKLSPDEIITLVRANLKLGKIDSKKTKMNFHSCNRIVLSVKFSVFELEKHIF